MQFARHPRWGPLTAREDQQDTLETKRPSPERITGHRQRSRT